MTASATDWNELARSKLEKVFGSAEAERLMRKSLSQIGLNTLGSADDLHRFANELSSSGGFAAPVGAMLSLTAVLRGAGGSGSAYPKL